MQTLKQQRNVDGAGKGLDEIEGTRRAGDLAAASRRSRQWRPQTGRSDTWECLLCSASSQSPRFLSRL